MSTNPTGPKPFIPESIKSALPPDQNELGTTGMKLDVAPSNPPPRLVAEVF